MRLVFTAFLLLSHSLIAQHPAFWQLSDEQGLPSATVFDLHQDTKGYIWIATESGLYRYDGKDFKLYKPHTSKASAMSSIREDSKGKLWFLNFSGQLFYIQQDSIYEYKFHKDLGGFTDYFIDSKDQLYTCHNNQKWYKHPITDNKPIFVGGEYIEEMQENKLLFFDYDQGFIKGENLSIQKKVPKEFVIKEALNYRHKKIAQQHILMERTTDRVFLLNFDDEKIWKLAPFQFQENNIKGNKNIELNAIKTDKEENIWILTYSGLYGYDKNLRPLYRDKNGKDIPLFAEKSISDLIQDQEGNYWISTLSDGIFVVPNKDLLVFEENLENLENKHIYKIAKDDEGNLLLGMYKGKVKVFDTHLQAIEKEYVTNNKKEIEAIFYEPTSQIIYISCNIGYFFHKNKAQCFKLPNLSAPKSFAIYQDVLLAANYEGVVFTPLSQQNKFMEKYKNKIFSDKMPNYFPFANKSRARVTFAENQSERIWLGYSNGLFIWENANIKEIKWKDSASIFAKSIAKDSLGNIWIGTLTQGLFLIKGEKAIKQIDMKAGLPSNFCVDIFAEKDWLWIGTDKGLAKLNLQNYQIETYNRQDGLPSEQINGLVVVEENVWLATPKGLIKLPKSIPSRNVVPPMIYIEQLSMWEQPQPYSDFYQFKHNENNLQINFLGVTYRGRGLFKYKYRMLGLDSSWIYTNSSNNFARYPSLPAGKYEFQVKAVNEDGIESEGIAVLQIEIEEPIWQRVWFLLLVFTLLAFMIFIVVRWRIRLLQKKNEIEKNLRESQLAALKVQMNPHFIFNALNSIQEFILLNEKKLANQYLGKFADLMRMTLDMSNEQTISLQEEIKMLNLYLQLEALRFENLYYNLEIDETLDTANILLPSMLIQPYIENALKHGLLHKKTDRKLHISFLKKGQYLECIVEDNGIGRLKSAEMKKVSKKHKSFAISATQKRLDLLSYGNKKAIQSEIIDLYDEQNKAIGTKVILRIPMV